MKLGNIQLHLTPNERKSLRLHKKKSDIIGMSIDELSDILESSYERAREMYALTDFQRIPTIGIKFAEDLMFLGFYTVRDLQNHDGAILTDLFEKKKGTWIDSCVEDQFRLAVHFSHHQDYTKRWWDFTAARKEYRKKHGYPKDRPQANWFDDLPNK